MRGGANILAVAHEGEASFASVCNAKGIAVRYYYRYRGRVYL
jgi:hypothetical protein